MCIQGKGGSRYPGVRCLGVVERSREYTSVDEMDRYCQGKPRLVFYSCPTCLYLYVYIGIILKTNH